MRSSSVLELAVIQSGFQGRYFAVVDHPTVHRRALGILARCSPVKGYLVPVGGFAGGVYHVIQIRCQLLRVRVIRPGLLTKSAGRPGSCFGKFVWWCNRPLPVSPGRLPLPQKPRPLIVLYLTLPRLTQQNGANRIGHGVGVAVNRLDRPGGRQEVFSHAVSRRRQVRMHVSTTTATAAWAALEARMSNKLPCASRPWTVKVVLGVEVTAEMLMTTLTPGIGAVVGEIGDGRGSRPGGAR
jgi:hypothetical protein